jgi:hypothetical protein
VVVIVAEVTIGAVVLVTLLAVVTASADLPLLLRVFIFLDIVFRKKCFGHRNLSQNMSHKVQVSQVDFTGH